MKYKCKICGDIVEENDLREHSILHNPNFDEVPWEDLPFEE